MELDLDNLIERVQSTHAKYLDEKARFKEELKSIQDEADTKIAQLTTELNVANETITEQEAKISKMASKEEVDQILNNDSAVYKELSNKYEALKEKYQKETAELTSTIESLNKNAENFDIYSQSLKDEIKESSTALANLQNSYNELELLKKESDNSLLELKTKLENIEKNNFSNNSIIADLKNEIQTDNEKISELNNNYNDLKQKTYGTIKYLVENVIEIKEQKIEELQRLLNDKSNTIDITTYQEATNQVNSLTSKVEQLTKDNATKDARIVELTQQISGLTEQLKELTPVQKTHSHLQDYIDSTIPIPEGTAAASANRPIRTTKSLEETVITPFGRVSQEVITNATRMIDKLYEDKIKNADGYYPLNNALQAAEDVGLSITTGNTIMDRLCAMSKDGKPIVFFNGNIYYATIDKEDLKNYILRG